MAVVQESSVPAIQQFNLPMMDPSVRPKSALARGVQIRSYKESCINPEPIMIEETDVLLEEYLSPRRLRALTGVDDLEQVTSLEMKVDTSETSLGNFGSMLPSLSQLKLSNSIIASIRDLGSSLDSLRVLWMGRCGLQELDGVSSMANLRELYLSYNEISELGPCSMLENIQILDLEGNNIEEISQVEFLALCSNLSNLTLDGNPICVTPSPDKAEPSYDYREAVIKALPQLKILDDEPIFKNTNKSKMSSLRPPKKKKQQVSVFEDDWALINELMAEGDLLNNEETDSPVPLARPGTAFRPTTGYTPGSVLRPTTAKRPMTMARPTTSRPMTSRPTTARPMTARPGTARPGSSDNTDLSTDDASQLTLGTVVCGNPSKALRARRKQTIQQPVVQTPPKLFSEYRSEPEKPYDQAAAVRDDKNLEGIFEELSEWRLHNSEVQAEREKENVPQVLRIDEEIVVSSDGEESDTEILYSALGPEPQDNLDSIDLDSAGHSDRSSLGVSTDRSSDFDTSKLEQDFMAEMERCSRLMYTEELDRENSAINRHSQRVTGHGSARVAGSGSGSGSAEVKSAARGTERQRGAESHNV
ncbi:leucine-rich repeat-containing protein 56-like isoform X2 [Lineus longissimus]|uniref:leucine-rich repeat-containing protein 56-like isoform X2 n=1 Tax=Lineus longissimus TaxID=88925 RepID=UPI00315DF9DE